MAVKSKWEHHIFDEVGSTNTKILRRIRKIYSRLRQKTNGGQGTPRPQLEQSGGKFVSFAGF